MARMDHLKRDFAMKVGVERSVGDAHGATAEFDGLAIPTTDELILVEAMRSASVIEIVAAERSLQEAGKTKLFRALG